MFRSSKRILLVVLAIIVLTCAPLATISFSKDNKSAGYSISFDMPSDGNLPMPVGKSFYVSGKIKGTQKLSKDCNFEVDMLNQNGEIIRHIYDAKQNDDAYFIYPKMTEKFCTDIDMVYKIIKSTNMCEYLVLDPSNPNSSFRNAEIKCSFSDNGFKGMIVAGTDEEHGAAVDDGCHFTDANGSPYTAFPQGKYTLRATLKDKNGKVLASAKKSFTVGNPKSALIMRFHPAEYKDHMLNQLKSIAPGSATNIDDIPGFMYGIGGHAGGRTMLFKANDMALYRNIHTYFQIYTIDPTSSSWTVEIPYLYYIDHIDNPDFFTSCYFDIGEPMLLVGKDSIKGKIVCFKPGDHHEICRIDSVSKNTSENKFDIRKSVCSTCLDTKNKTALVSADHSFAVMGVLAPAKLEDCFKFDQYQDDIQVTNRVETLSYVFTSGDAVIKYTKPVYLSRTNVEKNGGNYDSVLEYYHVFDAADFETGKTYRASVKGLDKNGKEVKGTEEFFSIKIEHFAEKKPFSAKLNKTQDKYFVEINGELNLENTKKARTTLADLLAKNTEISVIIDATGMSSITSTGLRFISDLRNACGKLSIINIQPNVYELFLETGFDKLCNLEKQYRTIDLTGCKVIGEGSKGIVYKYGGDTAVKVFKSAKVSPLEKILAERDMSRDAFAAGINCPVMFDVVRVGDKYALESELVDGKNLAVILQEDPSNTKKYIRMYAENLQKLHALSTNDKKYPSAKQAYIQRVKNIKSTLDDVHYRKLCKFIESIPESNHFTHGDYNPNNCMIGNGGHFYTMDLETLSVGDPIFDLATVCANFVTYGAYDHKQVEDFIGIKYDMAQEMWNLFIRDYYGRENVEREEARIKTVAFLKTLNTNMRVHSNNAEEIKFLARELSKNIDSLR